MPTVLSPSPRRYVVTASGVDAQQLQSALRPGESVEALGVGSDGRFVMDLGAERPSSREGWQQLTERLPMAARVDPVMLDDAGEEAFPTGAVGVRLTADLADEEVAAWAKRHGLEAGPRNRQVRTQWSLVAPAETFLPDVLARLAEDPEVRLAWPETRAAYRRW